VGGHWHGRGEDREKALYFCPREDVRARKRRFPLGEGRSEKAKRIRGNGGTWKRAQIPKKKGGEVIKGLEEKE